MSEVRTYVVTRAGRSTPSQTRIRDQIVRRFPVMRDLTQEEVDDLRGKRFVVTESTARVVDPEKPEPKKAKSQPKKAKSKKAGKSQE